MPRTLVAALIAAAGVLPLVHGIEVLALSAQESNGDSELPGWFGYAWGAIVLALGVGSIAGALLFLRGRVATGLAIGVPTGLLSVAYIVAVLT